MTERCDIHDACVHGPRNPHSTSDIRLRTAGRVSSSNHGFLVSQWALRGEGCGSTIRSGR